MIRHLIASARAEIDRPFGAKKLTKEEKEPQREIGT
jgi:hypothetical protein